MNFLADEHIDQPIVDRLRQDGHDVVAVAELEPGIADATILARANQGNALLLTADRDFGELVFRQRQVTAGVVLIRLAGLSSRAKVDIVSEVMRDHTAELLHAFTVISPGMVRIRPRT
jgi:predicted nuclease of predicted toxin-antitoxin system